MKKGKGQSKKQQVEKLSRIAQRNSPDPDQKDIESIADQPLKRPTSEKVELHIVTEKRGKKGAQKEVFRTQTEGGKAGHSVQDVSSIPPDEPEMELSEDREGDNAMMEYYEAGDLVFAKSEKGYLQPAFVVKALRDYTEYRVQFLDSPKKKTFLFEELKDYSQENIQNYLSLSERLPKDGANRIKKNIALAEIRFNKLKEREQQNKINDADLTVRKDDDYEESDVPKKQKPKVGRPNKNTNKGKISEGKLNQTVSKPGIKRGRKKKLHKQSQQQDKESSYSVEILPKEPPEPQVQLESEDEEKIQMKPEESLQNNEKESPKDNEEQSPQNHEIEKEEKQQLIEQEVKQSQQVLRTPKRIDTRRITIENDSAQIRESPFHSQRRSESAEADKEAEESASQTEQILEKFMREYNEINQNLFEVIKKLESLPVKVTINIAESILDNLNKYVTLELPYLQSIQITRRYGNMTDILAAILKIHLTDPLHLTVSKIIIKSINFVWHYQSLSNLTRNTEYVRYDYALVLSFVEHWSETYENSSKSIKGDLEIEINKKNILERLEFYNNHCKNKD